MDKFNFPEWVKCLDFDLDSHLNRASLVFKLLKLAKNPIKFIQSGKWSMNVHCISWGLRMYVVLVQVRITRPSYGNQARKFTDN